MFGLFGNSDRSLLVSANERPARSTKPQKRRASQQTLSQLYYLDCPRTSWYIIWINLRMSSTVEPRMFVQLSTKPQKPREPQQTQNQSDHSKCVHITSKHRIPECVTLARLVRVVPYVCVCVMRCAPLCGSAAYLADPPPEIGVKCTRDRDRAFRRPQQQQHESSTQRGE